MTPVGQILLSLMDDARLDLSLAELLCLRTEQSLPVSGVALTLADESGDLTPVAASGPVAVEVQRLQGELGEGPGVDAVVTGRLQQVPDLMNDGLVRWPAFTGAALELGVRSVDSFPLRIGGIRLGVMDLVRDRTGRLSARELASALHHVDAAVLVLLHLQERLEPDPEGSWLNDVTDETLHGHPEVHQATGMVSVQAGLTLAESLLLLRAHAFAAERPLAAIANDVVERRLRFDPDDTRPEGGG